MTHFLYPPTEISFFSRTGDQLGNVVSVNSYFLQEVPETSRITIRLDNRLESVIELINAFIQEDPWEIQIKGNAIGVDQIFERCSGFSYTVSGFNLELSFVCRWHVIQSGDLLSRSKVTNNHTKKSTLERKDDSWCDYGF